MSMLFSWNSSFSTFQSIQINTSIFSNFNPSLFSFSYHKNIAISGSKNISNLISNMNNIEWTWMMFYLCNLANSSYVVSCFDSAYISNFEFCMIYNFISGQIVFNCVICLNIRVRETNSTSIMSYYIRNFVRPYCSIFNS